METLFGRFNCCADADITIKILFLTRLEGTVVRRDFRKAASKCMWQLLAKIAVPIDKSSFRAYIVYRNVDFITVLKDLSVGLVFEERGQSTSGFCTIFRRKLTGSLPPTFTTIESWAINDDLPLRRLTLPKQQAIAGGR